MKANNFYNTTSESGIQLALYNNKARAQEDRILEFLRSNKDRFFSAHKVNRMVFSPKLGPQSLSRAFSNLKNAKKIIKSDKTMFMGEEKRMVHGWIYNNQYKGS